MKLVIRLDLYLLHLFDCHLIEPEAALAPGGLRFLVQVDLWRRCYRRHVSLLVMDIQTRIMICMVILIFTLGVCDYILQALEVVFR